ncbi:hypothetical protein KEM52_002124 [Ascosphaera acerosa]|nr:hypothetical protein KEM52_002124 [Ascosphaera acerosa]
MRSHIVKTKPSKAYLALQRLKQAKAEKWMYPECVPLSERKQVYLPDFTVALVRTPFMPPRYATFQVPLEFNKLDLKDYLRNAYGVETLKIRSYVEQQKPTRELRFDLPGHGPLRRPKSKKRMMVELAEPFVWPELPADAKKQFASDAYWKAKKGDEEYAEKMQDHFGKRKPEQAAKMLAEQAQALREGKVQWKPTWQVLGLGVERPLMGPQPPSRRESASASASIPPADSTSQSPSTPS